MKQLKIVGICLIAVVTLATAGSALAVGDSIFIFDREGATTADQSQVSLPAKPPAKPAEKPDPKPSAKPTLKNQKPSNAEPGKAATGPGGADS